MPKESLSHIHHFSLLLSFLLSCPLNFFPLPGWVWVGWMVGGDSICFQSFFFLNRHKKKTKNENFLFFLKSKVYLFFSSLSLNLRQAWMHWEKFPSNLSFFLFSFSLFFFRDFICSSFSFFVQFFRHFFQFCIFFFSFLYLFLSLFPCLNFPFFFYIFHFFVFVVEAFLPPLPSALGTILLWPVDFNLA